MADWMEELERLAELRDKDLITDEEFEVNRKEIQLKRLAELRDKGLYSDKEFEVKRQEVITVSSKGETPESDKNLLTPLAELTNPSTKKDPKTSGVRKIKEIAIWVGRLVVFGALPAVIFLVECTGNDSKQYIYGDFKDSFSTTSDEAHCGIRVIKAETNWTWEKIEDVLKLNADRSFLNTNGEILVGAIDKALLDCDIEVED